ncbi:MAG: hypothetical protein ABR976_01220 [Terracidiphilus sp.]|jgi:hypothetical protein
MKVTVLRFYKGFLGLQTIPASLPFLPPVLHVFIPDSSPIAEYLYPPLGESQQITLVATVLLLFLTTFVVFKYSQSSRKENPHLPIFLWIGAAIGVCALVVLYVLFVRRIAVPSANLEVPVSVGFQRTDFAVRWYPQWSDWAMLHDAGPYEEKIQMLWTRSSICVVRLLLWISYTLTLCSFLAALSLAVYQHVAEETPSEPKEG